MNLQILALLGMDVVDQKDKFLGEIPFMDNISIANTNDKQELRSGENMNVLHTTYSNYASEMSGTAVMSTDLFTLLFGEKPTESASTLMYFVDKNLIPSANKVILSKTPASGKRLYVFDTTQKGKRVELSLGDPTSDPTKYSIEGSTITVNTAVKSMRVSGDYTTQGMEFSKKAKQTPPVKVYAYCKYINLDTKTEDAAMFEATNAKFNPAFTLGASNGDMTKADISVDLNLDTTSGKSWMLKIDTAADA